MLQNTFIHVPSVGEKTEKDLWTKGIHTWSDLLNSKKDHSVRLTSVKRELIHDYIGKSLRAVKRGDAAFFSRLSKKGESWRLFPDFAKRCVYLDIETTGLSPVFDRITVVGLYDGKTYRTFVDGHNLGDLQEALKGYSVIVTFNGSQFDLRFLRIAFPELSLPPIHIDVRFVARKLGAVGGLKLVEKWFGIKRPSKIARLTGYDAAVLWSRYLRGDQSALDLLIDYNREDVIHLLPIMEAAYDGLVRQTAPFLRALQKHKPKTPRVRRGKSKLNGSATTAPLVAEQRIVVDLLEKVTTSIPSPRVVGIDLTGSKKRASGWALLDGARASTKLLSSDEEIVAETLAVNPDLVSIDSPLSLPSSHRIYRECELALRKMGISVFWCLLPSMKQLTIRGISLASEFRSKGLKVIESYPGAAQDILLIPRKKAGLDELKWGLARAGIRGDFTQGKANHDELDAITSALVGLFYLAGEYIPLGNAREDYLIVPRSSQVNADRMSKIMSSMDLDLVVGF